MINQAITIGKTQVQWQARAALLAPNFRWKTQYSCLKAGDMIAGRYEIKKKLGEGGCAQVYQALDTVNNQKVAIKIAWPKHRESLGNEARILDNVDPSPFIVKIHNHLDLEDPNDGSELIILEHLDHSLADEMNKQAISVTRAVKIILQIARGLQALGEVIHRDVNPGNIMFRKEGEEETAVLTDFNISTREPKIGEVVGTPAFMSPEQIEGKITDERTDIYSLGVVAYEMTTGRRFIDSDPRQEFLQIRPLLINEKRKGKKIGNESPVPPALKEVVNHMIEPDRENRISLKEVVAQLEAIHADLKKAERMADEIFETFCQAHEGRLLATEQPTIDL